MSLLLYKFIPYFFFIFSIYIRELQWLLSKTNKRIVSALIDYYWRLKTSLALLNTRSTLTSVNRTDKQLRAARTINENLKVLAFYYLSTQLALLSLIQLYNQLTTIELRYLLISNVQTLTPGYSRFNIFYNESSILAGYLGLG